MVKYFFYILLLITSFSTSAAAGEKQPFMDSSEVAFRSIDSNSINKYKSNKEFIYRQREQSSMSLWDRFWLWFWTQINKATSQRSVKKGLNIFIWILSIAMILYAAYRLTGMEKRFFMRSSPTSDISFQETEEDLNKIDLPAAIADAEAKGNYRLALRLQYLRSIKQLSDRGLIQFRINKTNHDYSRELAGSGLSDSFNRITWLYEFGWYGEFPVDAEMYNRIREIFNVHQNLLQA
jgi:hypothetical protein